ncbi:MAG: penicillin acylase family protein [Desulfomonilia bacterium]
MKASRMNLCFLHGRRRIIYYSVCTMVILHLFTSGCTNMVNRHFKDTVDPAQGTIRLPGLKEPVTVRRDAFGIPFIEAKSFADMAFAVGYVHASDRLTQMVGLKLASQGRLAEMVGNSALDLDIYMRTMNLRRTANNLLKNMSAENQALMEQYCRGVNAYQDTHKNKLPPGLSLSGYSPEQWRPIDSIMIFALVNLALSFNLYEETATLNLAQAIGAEKTAWLLPIYPDEPIPFHEATKLKGVDLNRAALASSQLADIQPLLSSIGLSGFAASNNWGIAKNRTKGGSSILCNDTHLLLSMPSLWNMLHVKCGQYDVAGINIAGLPYVVAGYNGHIAWGMTMVMADNQDIFLERLKTIDGKLHYLYKEHWLPTTEHQETIKIKGRDPVSITVHETRHGTLLNNALKKEPALIFQPASVDLPYGIALSWASATEDDESINAFFSLSFAKSVDEAMPFMKRIRAIALNMVFADKDNIAWQVTGNYPARAKGRGLMPSPGWTGEYDWTGLLDPSVLPNAKNPPEGYIGTANNRTIAKDYAYVLSSSWYWPERAERIAQMAAATDKHTTETCMAMQLDTYSPFVPKLKDVLLKGSLAQEITREINGWADEGRRKKAHLALEMLQGFDGDMQIGSNGAALVSALLHCATRNIFLDELGPEGSKAWKAFMVINNLSYNATCDHILIRGDESPFWDDVKTPGRETKAQILAGSLADAVTFLQTKSGSDPKQWQWGSLHTYEWETEAAKISPSMGFIERTAMRLLWSYFNRGPYPAPGDDFTLNVSNYLMGKDFDTFIIPAMRIIVDFSRDEPMVGVNSSGQSDNPSSPHYDDGIKAWLKGSYIPFPFKEDAVRDQYHEVLVLTP